MRFQLNIGLVVVGAIAYVIVGGPLVLAGGIAVGLALIAWHRCEIGRPAREATSARPSSRGFFGC